MTDLTDNIAGQLIEAYNRGFADGYECGLKDWQAYEKDMEEMRKNGE